MVVLTVRIDKALDAELRQFMAQTGQQRSEFVRDAVRRQLALARFEALRQRIAPFAEARGWLTDDDVFKDLT